MRYFEDPIYQEIMALKDWLIALRRDFHSHPELSELEFSTQERIIEELSKMGINNYPSAETGVCAVLLSNDSQTTIGLRADIDALPIQEESTVPYASVIPGVMHACGHDAHTTIQLGVAKYFSEHRQSLQSNLKFFFQPAEETIGGAERMVEEGVMNSPDVDFMLGLHVMPYMPVGEIEIRDGKLNAASDSFSIKIKGKSAHGAYPQQGVDAIVISAQVIVAIQTLISRMISPLDQAVITIGRIKGGVKDNIICDEVIFSGGMRTTDESTRTYLKDKIKELVNYTAQFYGGTGEVVFEPGYKALINNAEVTGVVRNIAQEVLGLEAVHEKELPSLGVEDFSYFLDHAKGAFYHLGCALTDKPLGALHTKDFQIDEMCLVMGTYLQIKIINALSNNSNKVGE
ncbi:M20 metallopeptidase family protein [Fusibacter bizertensis]